MSPEIVVLESRHRKKDFCCGKETLDQYLHFQAGQDVKRKLSACFVAVVPGSSLIQGYYTLSNYSLPLEGIPDYQKRKLPRSYSSIPMTLLGRLAVDQRFQGQGLGRLLLTDALYRSLTASKIMGSFALVVDPLDVGAENFYSKYGFIKLPDSGKMILALQTVIKLFR